LEGQPVSDFRKLLADAHLPERSHPVCLRGDLVAEWETLERQLADLRQGAVTGMEDASADLAERMEALRTTMRDHTYVFRIRALPKAEYRALKAEHPPRKTDAGDIVDEDRFLDADIDGIQEPLLRACLVDPVLDDDDWADLMGKLTDRQYSDLVGTAIMVNRGGVDIPFSPAASRHLRSSGSE
jgi:hypothetical protein